jgi:hypothetical protein
MELVVFCIIVLLYWLIFDEVDPMDDIPSPVAACATGYQKPDVTSGNLPDAEVAFLPDTQSESVLEIPEETRGVVAQDLPIANPEVFYLNQASSEFLLISNIPDWISIQDVIDRFEVSIGEIDPEYTSKMYDEYGIASGRLIVAFKNPSDARKAYVKTARQGLWIWESTQAYKIQASYHVNRKKSDFDLPVEYVLDWTNFLSDSQSPVPNVQVPECKKVQDAELAKPDADSVSKFEPRTGKPEPPEDVNQGYAPKLSTIPEDSEGEAYMAEMDHLMELLTSKIDENNKLQKQVSFLLEKKIVSDQQALLRENELKSRCSVACGPDVEVTTSSIGTQTEAEAALDCGSQISTDGFGLEMDQPSLPFYIPALEEEQPLKPLVVITEEKVILPPVFPCSDYRYQNKPMKGYVVDADGSKRTYGDLIQHQKTDVDTCPTKATEFAAFVPITHKKDNADTGPKVDDSSLVITSQSIQRQVLSNNKLLLKFLPSEQYGRIIGKSGSNIQRIENEFNVQVSMNKATDKRFCYLAISGSNDESRQAAADDIEAGLNVTTECHMKNVQLLSQFRIKKISQECFVTISTSPPDSSQECNKDRITINGKFKNCKSANAALVRELSRLR